MARTPGGAAKPEWAQQSTYVSGCRRKGMIKHFLKNNFFILFYLCLLFNLFKISPQKFQRIIFGIYLIPIIGFTLCSHSKF